MKENKYLTIQFNQPEMKGLILRVEKASRGQENWPRTSTLRHCLSKLLDCKDTESFDPAFESSITREKDQADFRFLHIQHFKTLERCLKILKDSTSEPRILYLSKSFSKNNDSEQTVLNLQKLKERYSTAVLEETFRG